MAWTENQLQVILDAMPMLFFEKDTENRIVRTNKAAADAVGATVEALAGSPTAQWFPDEAGEYYADDLRVMQSRQAQLGIVEQFQTAGDEKRWMRTDKHPLISGGGAVTGILVFAQDATAEAVAQESLRESENRLRRILESEPECVKVVDADGVILEMNAAGLRILEAATADEVLGTSMLEFVAPVYRDAVAGFLQGVQDGESAIMEFELIGRRGGRRWIESHAVLLDADERTVLAVARDVTDRRRAERERHELQEQVRHSQRLQSIGMLAGGVAHDFNNSLMAILGNAELALAVVGDGAPVARQLRAVIRASEQAADVCDQLLSYAGKRNLNVRAVDLSEVVREALDLLDVAIPKEVGLVADLADEVPLVLADAAQMTQVLLNLVTNAADAMNGARSEIRIATDVPNLTEAELGGIVAESPLVPGRYVRLTVSDIGSGMDVLTRQQMFDPFFSTKVTGRGLGLATVLGTIQGHRGGIRVSSVPGQGTDVEVILPLVHETTGPASGSPSRSRESTETEAKTILLVDEDPLVSDVIRQTLEGAGYRVLCATDGTQAIELWSGHDAVIDGAILDVGMPGLSCTDTYDELVRGRPELPTLFSTGFSEGEAAQQLRGRPSVGFIRKPYTGADLLMQLALLLQPADQDSSLLDPGGSARPTEVGPRVEH